MLRREKQAEASLVQALLTAAQPRVTCDVCGQVGQRLEAATDEDDGLWPDARTCDRCQVLLSPERLEIFPTARLCAACQAAQQTSPGEREFCPRCGDVLRLVTSRSRGLSQYVLACSGCGYSGTKS